MRWPSLAIIVVAISLSTLCKSYRRNRINFHHPRYNMMPHRYTHPWQDPLAYLYRPRYQAFHAVSLTGRIVGGSNAYPGDVPYQLRQILTTSKKEQVACGATLVDAFELQFAITAAHCVWDDTTSMVGLPKNLRLTAGELDLKKVSGDEQHRTAAKIVVHKDWDANSGDLSDDIALIFYDPPFELTSKVRPIELPKWRWDPPDELEVTGWGSTTTRRNPKRPDNLQVVTLPTIDNGECNRRFGHHGSKINWQVICGLDEGFKVGVCIGDSGGPAAAWNDSAEVWYLAGVSSYVVLGRCGTGRLPSVFVRVSAYIDWIWERVSEYL